MMQVSNEIFAALMKSYQKNAEDYITVLICRASDDELMKASANAICGALASLEPSVIQLAEQVDYKNSRYYPLDPASTNAVDEESDFDKARTNLKYHYGLLRLITHRSQIEHTELYAKIDSLPTLRKLYRINLAYSKQLNSEKSTITNEGQLIDINARLTILGLEKRHLTNEISKRILRTQNNNESANSSHPYTRSLEIDEHIINNKKNDLDSYANQLNDVNKILHVFYHSWREKKYLAALESNSRKIFYYQDIAQFETIDALLNQSYESLTEKAKALVEKHKNSVKEIEALELTISAKKLIRNTEAPIEPKVTRTLTNVQNKFNTIRPYLKRMLEAEKTSRWSDALDESIVVITDYCNTRNKIYRLKNQSITLTPADFVPISDSSEQRYYAAKKVIESYYKELTTRISLYERAHEIISSFRNDSHEPETPEPPKKKQRMS